MYFIDRIMEKWNQFRVKAAPVTDAVAKFLKEFKKAFDVVWDFVRRMHKVVIAVPVAWAAVVLAIYNESQLPAKVGLGLQISGDFSVEVLRELAVLGPVALTALCLLLMFVSRRTLTPWLVSLFTLALPLVILITNIYPA